jgi:N-acetylglucosaminyl-diphospho-decaprenol L-rhamnosyltransferase
MQSRSGHLSRAKVQVVIVNYRTPELVQDCVRSLWRLRPASVHLEIVIVDNCSADGSVEQLRAFVRDEHGPWPVRLLASALNAGFAAGNNVALAKLLAPQERSGVDPQFVWLLNPDTVVSGGNLDDLVRFFAHEPRAGIVGNRILDRDGQVQTSAFRRHTWQSELESALNMGPIRTLMQRYVVAPSPSREPSEVDWVSGASMFIRFELIRRVGLLDDNYFMYFEETDYCLAGKAAGYQIWYWPSFDVRHFEGSASGIHAGSVKRRPGYWFASRARFFRKNYSSAYWHLANLVWMLAYPFGRTWRRLRGKPCMDPPRLWWDFLVHNYLSRN